MTDSERRPDWPNPSGHLLELKPKIKEGSPKVKLYLDDVELGNSDALLRPNWLRVMAHYRRSHVRSSQTCAGHVTS